MKSTKPVSARIGVIGLGRMGARVIEAAENIGMDVVGLHDLSPEPFAYAVRPELAELHCETLGDLFSHDLDVLAIATTAPSHTSLVEAGIKADVRQFMVEKPFCDGVGEGERILALADEVGARIVVNHGRRYHPGYTAIAALNGSPEMGELRSISVSMGAGGLGCMGVHYLDVFNQIFGELPGTVYGIQAGETAANPRGAQFDDPGACAILSWPNGRRAVIDMCDDLGIPPWLEFRFTYGRIVIENEGTPWRQFHRTEEDRALPLTRYGQPNSEIPFAGYEAFGIIDMCEAALRDTLLDLPQTSGGETALDAIRVFAALRHSIETGLPVSIPISDVLTQRRFAIP